MKASLPAGEQAAKRFAGMTGFALVWIGQIVSVLASGMTTFAKTI